MFSTLDPGSSVIHTDGKNPVELSLHLSVQLSRGFALGEEPYKRFFFEYIDRMNETSITQINLPPGLIDLGVGDPDTSLLPLEVAPALCPGLFCRPRPSSPAVRLRARQWSFPPGAGRFSIDQIR